MKVLPPFSPENPFPNFLLYLDIGIIQQILHKSLSRILYSHKRTSKIQMQQNFSSIDIEQVPGHVQNEISKLWNNEKLRDNFTKVNRSSTPSKLAGRKC